MIALLLSGLALAGSGVLGMTWGEKPGRDLGEPLHIRKEIAGHPVDVACYEPQSAPRVELGESMQYVRLCYWNDGLFEIELHAEESYSKMYTDILHKKYGEPISATSQHIRWENDEIVLVVWGNRIKYQHQPTLSKIREGLSEDTEELKETLLNSL